MEIVRCGICGNIVTKAVNGGGPLSCCGKPMQALEAGVTDAALEKHVPALRLDGATLTVTVGETVHPMTAEHYIQMILVRQGARVQYTSLAPTGTPEARFTIDPGEPVEVYEYCNLHGLWKNEQQFVDDQPDEIVCSAEFPDGCTN